MAVREGEVRRSWMQMIWRILYLVFAVICMLAAAIALGIWIYGIINGQFFIQVFLMTFVWGLFGWHMWRRFRRPPQDPVFERGYNRRPR